MKKYMRRGVIALLATGACAGLAACGGGGSSDNPKVSDAAFVTKCISEGKSKTNAQSSLTSEQKNLILSHVDQICQCGQQKFEAKGQGDARYNDASIKNDNEVGTQCAQQVLGAAAGGSGSSGTSSGQTTT